ncbi:MAG: EVE domain-containing protein [Pseudomonadota bacterium]
MAYWLMKSEPDSFGIDHLKKRGTEPWSGVRNYQARNFMRDKMKEGDLAFMYHSSCEQPGVYGVMKIVTRSYPDPTQFDRKSPYYDEKSTREDPRWWLVDVKYQRHLKKPILLPVLREHADQLHGLRLLMRGDRLSVSPVSAEHWNHILSLE